MNVDMILRIFNLRKNDVWLYTFGGETDNSVVTYATRGNHCYDNTIGVNRELINKVFKYKLPFNTFGNGCNSNTFGYGSYSNNLGDSCYYNTFGDRCTNNTFGISCYSNTFGKGCGGNNFGGNCHHNTFGNSCGGNTFGYGCWHNTFGISCTSNKFYTGISGTTTKEYIRYIVLENSCRNNNFLFNSINKWCIFNFLTKNKNKGVR